MASQVKLIGKTILDKSGITEFFGGEINIKDIKPLPIYVDRTDWVNFKSEINDLEKDPVQVDLYLKAHGLDQVEGLKDYILNNDIKQDSVNNLIQTQNYKNIANQAHGIKGVNSAIKEYNKLTTEASKQSLQKQLPRATHLLETILRD